MADHDQYVFERIEKSRVQLEHDAEFAWNSPWHAARRKKRIERAIRAASRLPAPKPRPNGSIAWTEKMIECLRVIYPCLGRDAAAKHLQVSVGQVRRKVEHLKLTMDPHARTLLPRKNGHIQSVRRKNQTTWNRQLREFAEWAGERLQETVGDG